MNTPPLELFVNDAHDLSISPDEGPEFTPSPAKLAEMGITTPVLPPVQNGTSARWVDVMIADNEVAVGHQ